VTKAIYLEPNGHGGYDVKTGGYFKQVNGDRDILVVVSKNGNATSTPLTHDELVALRDGIDDVLRGAR
jgi:hypothetical protein